MLLGPNGGVIKSPSGGVRKKIAAGVSQRALLQMSDLTYVGSFKWPTTITQEFAYAWGIFTARRVGGTLRFYALGNPGWPHDQKLYTFDFPGYDNGAHSASRSANFIADFGTIWDTNRPVASDSLVGITKGMYWKDDVLWWAYTTGYEGTSNNPVLSATTLNETTLSHSTTGPWRAKVVHSGFFNHSMMDVPSWFQTAFNMRPSVQIPSVHNQNATAPWGLNAVSFTLPNPASTPDTVGVESEQSIDVTQLAHYTQASPQARTANFKVCGWNVIYDCLQGSYVNDASQQWGGGGSLLDWVDTASWVDTGTKHGIVAFGQWVDAIPGFSYPNGDTMPHVWYGPGQCCHGHDGTPMWQATGPGASTVVDYAFIQDPVQLGQVNLGQRTVTGTTLAQTAQLNTLSGYTFDTRCTQLYKYGSSYYDATSGLLFVSQREAAASGFGTNRPVMLVFQVG